MANLLVIDDDPVARRVVGRLLRGLGHRVWKAADGPHALRELKRRSGLRSALQGVVVDLVLPGMSGLELARRIRTRWPALSIIAISAYTCPESIWTLWVLERLGVRGVLQKPVDRKTLRAALARTLKGLS